VNTRTALVSLVLAIALAAGAWLALKPAPAPPPASKTWINSLNTGQVTAMAVRWQDGQSATIKQSATPQVWILTLVDAKGSAQGAAWPVDAGRVQATLRLIGELATLPPAAAGPNAAGTTVTLKTESGVEHTLSLSEAALGGKTLVHIEGTPDSFRLADAGLVRLFAQDGLRAWRTTTAFSQDASDISRVRMETTGRQITLARVQGHWGVQSPVVAPADQAAAAQLGARLIALPVVRFLEGTPDAATGLANPAALIETETEFRTTAPEGVQRRVLTQQLKLGGPADGAAGHLYANLEATWLDPTTRKSEVAWGPALVLINRASFEPITADTTQFLSKQSIETPAADLTGFALSQSDAAMVDSGKTAAPAPPGKTVRLTRTIDGWRFKPEQGELRMPAPSDAAQIDALVHVLTQQAADAVGLEAPNATQALAIASIETGGTSAQVGFGVAEVTPVGKAAQPALIIRSGPIYRVYLGKQALDVGRWIKDELPPEG
jgi:hypothetical protein